jgi:hypothetical protein
MKRYWERAVMSNVATRIAWPALTAALVLWVPAVATAQESYLLKIPAPDQNNVNRVECGMSQTFRMAKHDAFGQEYKSESSFASSHLVYIDTFLELKDGEVSRFRRHFNTATQCVKDDPAAVMSCEGKTVLVEIKDGKTQLRWENGEPPPSSFVAQVEALLKQGKGQLGEFAHVDVLPGFAVKVGQSWSVDVDALVRNCQEKQGCEIKGVKAEATLQKVEKREGSSFAVVLVKVHIPLKRIEQGKRAINLDDASGMTWEATYDFCCDGTCSALETRSHFHFLTDGRSPEESGLSTHLRLDTEVDLSERRTAGK